jgi:hypothetical protein
MALLRFNDRGWEVVTASCSAGTTKPGKVSLMYLWTGLTGHQSGVCQIILNIDMERFLAMVTAGRVVDLRSIQ